MESAASHLRQSLDCIKELQAVPDIVNLDGHNLTVAALKRIASDENVKVKLTETAVKEIEKNAKFLENLVDNDSSVYIYGLNTGVGGSADVRTKNAADIQNSILRLLNIGFGRTFPPGPVRAAMAVRANSLSLAYSGVSANFVQKLTDLINCNIVPAVPIRGSISASGDLIPMSYVAAALVGREDLNVYYKGEQMKCLSALRAAEIKPAMMVHRDGLAVVNGTSFTVGVSAPVLYDANIACLLTQTCTALAVEALHGTTESFHPVIQCCMPHCGQMEVAKNLRELLHNSKLAVQRLDMNKKETLSTHRLKQDRYSLRSAAQWIGPVVETMKEANRKFRTELQGVSDNPIIDHRTGTILNGANFQGETLSLTLDQMRQGLGVCGKLLFAQFSELVNVNLNFDLPPNLSGSDFHVDFGFKGADIAMAAYMSELDQVVNPMSNHVVSAELHNQSVNSLALISCRLTKDALELLQMMLANHLNMLVQAVDLRYLRKMASKQLSHISTQHTEIAECIHQTHWYEFVLRPNEIMKELEVKTDGEKSLLVAGLVDGLQSVYSEMKEGRCHTDENLGQGTRRLYTFVRETLGIPFYHGQGPMDKWIDDIFNAIKDGRIDDVILDVFAERNAFHENC
ncbi:uncharacterized protein LOC123547312 isoform X1 [Mercenaria mercenaria]|uniref:uncharacterized protein LOC123547312 isoform X1 n=1 Tax=Mercenaria mercenaria TaxID=6596 RepID=UPI00234E4097|nr:uncharacterized protein LOC123547312 isoform X1 [Mercenaria mercenaria]